MKEGCCKSPTIRGLCPTHYHYLHQLVASRKTTWKQLEEEGRCRVSHWKHDPSRKHKCKQKCIVSGCEETRVARDLCWHHYARGSRRIKAGKFQSWDEYTNFLSIHPSAMCNVEGCTSPSVQGKDQNLCKECWIAVDEMLKQGETTVEQLQASGVFKKPDSRKLILHALNKL